MLDVWWSCAGVRTPEAAQRGGQQSKRSPGMYFLFEQSKDVLGMLWHAETLPLIGQVRTGNCVKARMKEYGKIYFKARCLPVVHWDCLIVFDIHLKIAWYVKSSVFVARYSLYKMYFGSDGGFLKLISLVPLSYSSWLPPERSFPPPLKAQLFT